MNNQVVLLAVNMFLMGALVGGGLGLVGGYKMTESWDVESSDLQASSSLPEATSGPEPAEPLNQDSDGDGIADHEDPCNNSDNPEPQSADSDGNGIDDCNDE